MTLPQSSKLPQRSAHCTVKRYEPATVGCRESMTGSQARLRAPPFRELCVMWGQELWISRWTATCAPQSLFLQATFSRRRLATRPINTTPRYEPGIPA
jgi:hypothetical protein